MTKLLPLVSVIIPSYNHSAFVTKCVESVCTQEYPNKEIIVIDDGSTDNSLRILEQMKRIYDFHLIPQKNVGLSATLNRGITEFAGGKYFTICSSDDYWLPGKIAKQVEYLEDHPDIPMVFSKSKIIDFDGNFLEDQTFSINRGLKGGMIFKEVILQEFHLPVNYMFRSEIFDKVGLFDEKAWAEDFDMNLRISIKYPIGFIDEFLACYRRGQNSNSVSQPKKIIYSHRYSIDKFKSSSLYTEAVRQWHFRNFIWFACRKDSKWFALKSMILSIRSFTDRRFIKGLRDLFLRWY
jgi:alpha-1,3-rhamnosyltransferase